MDLCGIMMNSGSYYFESLQLRPYLRLCTFASSSCLMVGFSDRGELFVWGKNIRGCLGIGKRDDQYFPWRVRQSFPVNSKKQFLFSCQFLFFWPVPQVTVPGQVVDVACGVDHMVALVKSLLWGWMFTHRPLLSWGEPGRALEAICSRTNRRTFDWWWVLMELSSVSVELDSF